MRVYGPKKSSEAIPRNSAKPPRDDRVRDGPGDWKPIDEIAHQGEQTASKDHAQEHLLLPIEGCRDQGNTQLWAQWLVDTRQCENLGEAFLYLDAALSEIKREKHVDEAVARRILDKRMRSRRYRREVPLQQRTG